MGERKRKKGEERREGRGGERKKGNLTFVANLLYLGKCAEKKRIGTNLSNPTVLCTFKKNFKDHMKMLVKPLKRKELGVNF